MWNTWIFSPVFHAKVEHKQALTMTEATSTLTVPDRVWAVGALCRAVADALEARFSPVTVRGELTGFSRAASGHCYFSIKDAQGQIRCAMFRRAASMLEFAPKDGELVELWGRLTVYEQRGDLQLVVEGMRRAGQGALFEQFLKLKAKLEAEGLFDLARKRPLPHMPKAIGLVTSLGAAALHDVVTALHRRAPHIPVVLAPAAVQGAGAPQELVTALQSLYAQAVHADVDGSEGENLGQVDVILLVRGGGAMEDLWAFNDEALARTLAVSPVPVVCGVGHETDFTIADFVADVRAPTPTAAAEMVSPERDTVLQGLEAWQQHLTQTVYRALDQQQQRLDWAAGRLGRPSVLLHQQAMELQVQQQKLGAALAHTLRQRAISLDQAQSRLPAAAQRRLEQQHQKLDRAGLRLDLLDPKLVLQRGYAWLQDEQGFTVSRTAQARLGQALQATLADGSLGLTVQALGPSAPVLK
jgi:exodeoxyribonuclease VII large subunit